MSTKALIDRRILDVCACNNPLFESSFTCNRTLKCGNKRQFNYFPQPLLLGRLLSRSVLLPERLEQAILALCMSTPICMRTALVADSLHMVSICINVFGLSITLLHSPTVQFAGRGQGLKLHFWLGLGLCHWGQ